MAYKTIEIDVDLSEFSNNELIEELKSRGREVGGSDETEVLTKAWLADREGRKDEAYALLREYMLEKLGKVV